MNGAELFSTGYINRLHGVLDSLDVDAIERAIDLIESTWAAGNQVITLGNGGSALTAQHYVNDWSKSISLASGRPFRARCLCDNVGLLMSYANDIRYEEIFSEQLKTTLLPGDLVVALSGSGNSENVISAVHYANNHQGVTLGICGYNGGALLHTAQHAVRVPVDDMQLCEDVHLMFGHMVMQRLCALPS